jgi:hypothetical protein
MSSPSVTPDARLIFANPDKDELHVVRLILSIFGSASSLINNLQNRDDGYNENMQFIRRPASAFKSGARDGRHKRRWRALCRPLRASTALRGRNRVQTSLGSRAAFFFSV